MRDWHSEYEDYEKRAEADRRAARLRDILAESTAAEIGPLRLALAEILVAEHGTRSFQGNCICSEGKGCSGHVTETTKIARRALGLHELPDRPRVPKPPEPPVKPKRTKKKAVRPVEHE